MSFVVQIVKQKQKFCHSRVHFAPSFFSVSKANTSLKMEINWIGYTTALTMGLIESSYNI